MKTRLSLALIASLCFVSAGYLAAQQPGASDNPTTVANQLVTTGTRADQLANFVHNAATAMNQEKDPAKKLVLKQKLEADVAHEELALRGSDVQVYHLAANDTRVPAEFAVETLYKYYEGARFAKTPDENAQLAATMSLRLQGVQVAQNARIIELLEKMTAGK